MRILIALSGHDIDNDISATAARLADPARDEIIAVHVAHPRDTRSTYERLESTDTAARAADPSTMTVDRPIEAPTEGAEQATERLAADFRDHVKLLQSSHLKGLNVQSDLLVNSNAGEAIVEAVDRHHADAVVMGTHSKRSRLASAIIGSRAEEVIRRVSVPVTVVKEGTVAGVAAD